MAAVADAASTEEPPGLIDGGVAETVPIVTDGPIETVTVVDPVQPLEFPVTVYVVVPAGLAFTTAPVVASSPVDGDHE